MYPEVVLGYRGGVHASKGGVHLSRPLINLLQTTDSYRLSLLNELGLRLNFIALFPRFFLDNSAKIFDPLINMISGLRKVSTTVSLHLSDLSLPIRIRW